MFSQLEPSSTKPPQPAPPAPPQPASITTQRKSHRKKKRSKKKLKIVGYYFFFAVLQFCLFFLFIFSLLFLAQISKFSAGPRLQAHLIKR